jgi:nicotinamide mononucleotide (NMN) deamidase PncC
MVMRIVQQRMARAAALQAREEFASAVCGIAGWQWQLFVVSFMFGTVFLYCCLTYIG